MIDKKAVGSDLVESIMEGDPEISSTLPNTENVGRPRSNTLLKLQWLSDRMRKTTRIYEQVREGTYQVDSRDVAKAMLNLK